jgi:hypothetical protein
MSNLGIKVNLKKLKNAAIIDVKGRETTKRGVFIPIDDNSIFVSEKGWYFNLVAFEMKDHKYDDTHLVKLSLEKEVYDAMTEEERNNQPIIGGIRPIVAAKFQTEASGTVDASGDGDDLPF